MILLVGIIMIGITGVMTQENLRNGDYMIVDKQRYFVHMKNTNPLTQASAAVYCAGLDMDLPDMASEKKQRALDLAIKSVNYNDNKRSRTFWTSGLRGSDDSWTWTNLDRTVTYTNWQGGEPVPGQEAIYYETYQSVWHGAPSDSVLYDVVCQQPRKCN